MQFPVTFANRPRFVGPVLPMLTPWLDAVIFDNISDYAAANNNERNPMRTLYCLYEASFATEKGTLIMVASSTVSMRFGKEENVTLIMVKRQQDKLPYAFITGDGSAVPIDSVLVNIDVFGVVSFSQMKKVLLYENKNFGFCHSAFRTLDDASREQPTEPEQPHADS